MGRCARDFAVERHRRLEGHKRLAGADEMRERLVQFARFRLQHAFADINSGLAKLLESFACDQRIGIAHGRHDASDSRGKNRLRTRPGSAGVAAGLEIQVESVAARQRAGFFQGEHFGMLAFGELMKAAPDDSSALIDHKGADTRIGRGKPDALARQFERLCHEKFVCRAPCHS